MMPPTDKIRPLEKLPDGRYAEWCPCGAPPGDIFAVMEFENGALLIVHLECIDEFGH